MPGLFGDNTPGGLLGMFMGNYQPGNLAVGASPGLQQNQFRQQGSNYINQQPGMAGMGPLIMSNPAGAQVMIGQRNLQLTHDALVGQPGPNGQPISDAMAWTLAMHPDIINEQGKPINVSPGGAVYTPLFGGQGGAPNSSQQQPPSSQPAGGSQQGGTVPGAQFSNTNGLIDPITAQNLAKRYVHGDKDVLNMGSMAGPMGQQNREILQRAINQEMATNNMSPTDVSANIAKFPAYQDALKTNAEVGARMNTGQTEALRLLPQVVAAAKSINPSDFPVWNAAKQTWLAQTGDPRVASLASFMNALTNTYSRAITTNPRGPTVSDKEHLRDVVNPYWSNGQWDAGAQAIVKEMEIAQESNRVQINKLNSQYGFGKDADPNDVAAAKAAIAKGADKKAVMTRFEEGGFNAPKF